MRHSVVFLKFRHIRRDGYSGAFPRFSIHLDNFARRAARAGSVRVREIHRFDSCREKSLLTTGTGALGHAVSSIANTCASVILTRARQMNRCGRKFKTHPYAYNPWRRLLLSPLDLPSYFMSARKETESYFLRELL